MNDRWWIALALGLASGLLGGCGVEDSLPSPPELFPVTGKVTVQGEPLAEAVVTFLQVDEKGTLAVGETQEDGTYILSHVGTPGAAAASYKVAISYLVGEDGTIYGLGPRSGLAKPHGMLSAKELIPQEWSDLGIAEHVVEVPEGGGVIDLDIDVPLLPPPPPASPSGFETSAEPSPEADSPESEDDADHDEPPAPDLGAEPAAESADSPEGAPSPEPDESPAADEATGSP
ncbi:hypothetical protein [Tautonia plasticadhaerens]|uniref:Carboxypeptidase regulatory-like domain-containing protein n=1 Tax=Tautonia plasticadhaerens TaxID=2527974 RepID=A0A518H0V6_9BACT|nr:hypothetical protein [Tautonia plasticadhaerens]QDV34476.1 hypothetical protein ElP_23650 [Tautonia plasticadhaerens]